jgi:hypothetical protein
LDLLPALESQLDELEARRVTLTVYPTAAASARPRLHPNLAQVCRDKVARLRGTLQSGPDAQEALDGTVSRSL